jgi:hypothetical protein
MKFDVSIHYYIAQATWYVYLYKHVWNDRYLSFKRKKKPKHLKLIYLSKYLNKMKQRYKKFEYAII